MAVRIEDQGEGFLFLYLMTSSLDDVVESILRTCREESTRVLALFGLEILIAQSSSISAFQRLEHLQQTLIAVVEGDLSSAGSDLALCCDLVVVGKAASFTCAEVKSCLDQGPLGPQYQWSSHPDPILSERVPADQLLQLGVAIRLSGCPKEDAMTLGSRLALLIRDYHRSIRQTFASSWRYKPKL